MRRIQVNEGRLSARSHPKPDRPQAASNSHLQMNIHDGMPVMGITDQAERNEVVLGGFVLNDNKPDRECLSCGNELQIVSRPE